MTREDRPTTAADLLAQDRTIRALMSLADDLSVERDEEGLLGSTLEHVVQALALTGGLTFVLDDEGTLRPEAECRLPSPDLAATRDLAARALEAQRPVVEELPGGGWMAATPLRTRERQLGVLTLHDQGHRSLAPETELLGALGKQIGTGLDNVRAYAELRASSARTQVLNRITTTLTSSMDLKTVVAALAREVAPVQGFDRLICAFVNDSGDYIEVVGHPEDASWGLGTVIPVVGSGPGAVVLDGRAVLRRDILRDHRFIEDLRLLEEGIRCYMLLPLTSRGRNVGVLGLCLGAADLGYRVVVPSDAVVGVPVDYGDEVLRHSIAMVATLTTADELLAGWT